MANSELNITVGISEDGKQWEAVIDSQLTPLVIKSILRQMILSLNSYKGAHEKTDK